MGEWSGDVITVRQRKQLTILRDDHIGDSIGAMFLDCSPEREDTILERLGDYLGSRVKIVKLELSADRAEVEIEVRSMTEEASRLAATARDLSRKGAKRGALSMFRDALELDPINRKAALGLGLLLSELEQFSEAMKYLKLARECGTDDPELLYALGQVSLKSDRTAAAIEYFERAVEIDPGHFAVRRALAELGRKPKPQRPRTDKPQAILSVTAKRERPT
jgi:tetratricopeptide (TPR) repeat protein